MSDNSNNCDDTDKIIEQNMEYFEEHFPKLLFYSSIDKDDLNEVLGEFKTIQIVDGPYINNLDVTREYTIKLTFPETQKITAYMVLKQLNDMDFHQISKNHNDFVGFGHLNDNIFCLALNS
jgi:hypothetical protein